ncbi:MAG TPA: hypothetical protein VHR66_25685 [Gemmataceae bacterium]|nr:hypothetical protein [Gemmataceae bacterium]
MSVIIDKLATRCRVSRRRASVARIVDEAARQRLAIELTQFVGPALSRQPRVVRIRRLSVKLVLTAEEVGTDALVAAWVRALAKSLFEALAHTGESGADRVVRAGTIAEFHAAFLRDLLAGNAGGRWEYAELDDLLDLPATEAALSLLLERPLEIAATLAVLDDFAMLERLLIRFDDLAIERLFAAISGVISRDALAIRLSLDDLLWCARQTLAAPALSGFTIDARRQALRIFVRTRGAEDRSPREIFQALLSLTCLLECPEILHASPADEFASAHAIERRTGRRLPPAVATMLVDLHRHFKKNWHNPSSQATELLAALDQLRPLVPTAALVVLSRQSPWLEVESAGLLLLARIVERLGWNDLCRDALPKSWGGPRFFQNLLAGIGSTVLEHFKLDATTLDLAVIIFAGMEREPSMSGLRHWFDSIDARQRWHLLELLELEFEADSAATTWAATLDALTAKLTVEFAKLVPGFRQASRPAIVRQFIRMPGRVQVDEHKVSVQIAPTPFHVALHVSGLDDPLPAVSWMGGRRLEFKLLGL